MASSGKHIVFWVLGAGAAAVIAVVIFLSRDLIAESWYLHILKSADGKTRIGAIEGLGRFGADRSVPRLLDILPAERSAVLSALRRVHPRCGRRTRDKAIDRLLLERPWENLVQIGGPPQENIDLLRNAVLVELAANDPDQFPRFIDHLRSGDERIAALASAVLCGGWMHAPEAVEGLARKLDADGVIRLLRPVFLAAKSQGGKGLDGVLAERIEGAHGLARRLLERSEDARVRIACVSFHRNATIGGFATNMIPFMFTNPPQIPLQVLDPGFEVLRETFDRDRDPAVKAACLRIAGVLGPESLDLSRIIATVEDPALLVEALEARAVWVTGPGGIEGLRLPGDIDCRWLRISDFRHMLLEPAESERIREILRESGDPRVRDAASLVIASQYRESKGGPWLPICRTPGFKVHEWGVWRDDGGVLEPRARLLDDLPPFVHRLETRPEAYEAERLTVPAGKSMSPFGFVAKPVVFFHAREPLEALVAMRFKGGMPWMFFPEPTDYLEEVGMPILADRPEIQPPWIRGGAAARAATGELSRRCRVASWIVPPHPKPENQPGSLRLAGLGLEWCGLRIGHDPALEAKPAAVPPGSWWSALRDVPASPVAIRGESERFLFYDGAVPLPPPVRVRWADAARSALLVDVPSFEAQRDLDGGVAVLEKWRPQEERTYLSRLLPVPAVLVIRKLEGREAEGAVVESLEPAGPTRPVSLESLDLRGAALAARFLAVLEAQGLDAAEAEPLVRTWRREFFEEEGLRAITVLPRWIYEAALPLMVLPAPEEIVRVGLVWKELDER
jgi:hypothetical protein